eukprot:gene35463-52876_t
MRVMDGDGMLCGAIGPPQLTVWPNAPNARHVVVPRGRGGFGGGMRGGAVRRRPLPAAPLLAASLLPIRAVCDEASHQYGGLQIGPFHNPLETYGYFDVLPWCPPRSMQARQPSLGEALTGDELIPLPIDVRFRKRVPRTVICSRKMTAADGEATVMRNAVSEQYWYQLHHRKAADPLLYLHQRFSLGYNGDRVVVANLTVEDPREVPADGGEFEFSYSVEWTESRVAFAERFRRYLDESFFEHKIHWFAVCNSFMMVFFLLGLVFTIMQVHSEVFRVPPDHVLLCALVGTGAQICLLSLAIIVIAIALHTLHTSRTGLLTYG